MPEPSDASWWRGKIKMRAMSWYSRIFPFEGKLFASLLYIIIIIILGWIHIFEPFGTKFGRISVFLLAVFGVLGLGLPNLLSSLEDNYKYEFRNEALNIVNEELEGANKKELQNIVNDKLSTVDRLDKEDAREKVDECADQLAEEYESIT